MAPSHINYSILMIGHQCNTEHEFNKKQLNRCLVCSKRDWALIQRNGTKFKVWSIYFRGTLIHSEIVCLIECGDYLRRGCLFEPCSEKAVPVTMHSAAKSYLSSTKKQKKIYLHSWVRWPLDSFHITWFVCSAIISTLLNAVNYHRIEQIFFPY